MNLETAYKYLSEGPDDKIVKFPWQEVRLMPYQSVSVDEIASWDEIGNIYFHRTMAVDLKGKFASIRRPRTKEVFLSEAIEFRDGHLREWMYGQFRSNQDIAVAVSKRPDGRFNVSMAKFYKGR